MRNSQPPYSETTIETYLKHLARMDKLGVDLDNPTQVLLHIATRETWGYNQRAIAQKAYHIYARVYEIQMPKQKLRGGKSAQPKTVPYIPGEKLLELFNTARTC